MPHDALSVGRGQQATGNWQLAVGSWSAACADLACPAQSGAGRHPLKDVNAQAPACSPPRCWPPPCGPTWAPPRRTMSKADYNACQDARWRRLQGGPGAVRRAEGQRQGHLQRPGKRPAEGGAGRGLSSAYAGKATDGSRLRVVTAEAAYAVAKEKCDDLAGNDKDVCVKQGQGRRGHGAGRGQAGQGSRRRAHRCGR
jgi:hypothetical protein